MMAEQRRSTAAEVELAIRAAEELMNREGLASGAEVAEPVGPEATCAAVERLGRLFVELPGQMRYGLRRQRDNGGDLSTDPLQGLSEIVQNANDLGAHQVRIFVRDTELLVAHDGRPVRLTDVMALAMPSLTSKDDDPDATGRFGIGLMTLRRLSPVLEIFCGFYRVRIGDPDVSLADPFPVPSWFADDGWTVLRIPLATPADVQGQDVDDWLAAWGDEALLFLDHVRTVEHQREGGDVHSRLALEWGEPDAYEAVIGGRDTAIEVRTARSPGGMTWQVSRATVLSPPDVPRIRKAAGESTGLAVAIPLDEGAGDEVAGQVHVGLPVTELGLPLRVGAQFDPNPSRQHLNDTPWNQALLPLLADLWAAVMVRQLRLEPTAAWRCLPLPHNVRSPKGPVRDLEQRFLTLARARVSYELRLRTPLHGDLGLADLAVGDEALLPALSEAEIAQVAGRTAVLPPAARDAEGRWQEVLEDWAEHDGAVPGTVTVPMAVDALLGDASRSPEATVALASVAIAEGETQRLRWHKWLVDLSGARHQVPWFGTAEFFTDKAQGLAKVLGLSHVLHPAFVAETGEAARVRAWLSEQQVFVTGADPVPAIRQLAARGAQKDIAPLVLDDDQLVALREGFLRVPAKERQRLGKDVGRAVLLHGRRFGPGGRREDVQVRPADAYLPAGLDSVDREDSFETAAGTATGLTWLRPRYAQVLPGAGTGLGARAFFHLLGAEKGPRLRPHPGVEHRFTASSPSEGLPAQVPGGPAERSQDLRNQSATYTLEDCDSPDLMAVVHDIAAEKDGPVRRLRAAALLRVLGRNWGALSEHHKVRAVRDYHTWNPCGETDGFWLWQLKTTAWLDNQDGAPVAPSGLRERTTSTVAVYGADSAGFLHPDLQQAVGRRGEVLVALGVTGEPGVADLLEALRRLRARETEAPDQPAAQLLYRALAERLTAHRGKDAAQVTATVVRAFGQGRGLILTSLGWRRPGDCFRGLPVFGRWAAFASSFKGSDALWETLAVPEAGVEDAVRVVREVAREARAERGVRAPVDAEAETVMLQTLQMLARTAREHPERVTASLVGRLPLRTSRGWTSKRPVYAADATLAEALGSRIPVWLPGGELEQFTALLGPLRVIELGASDITFRPADDAPVDMEATDLVRHALDLLREDLQRNAVAVAGSLDCPWEDLAEVEVRITSSLECMVTLPDGEPVRGPVRTALDRDSRTLWTVDRELLRRPSEAGRAVATRFTEDRRQVAHSWAAAYDEAERGREAVRLELAEERVAQDQAATDAKRAQRLAALETEVKTAQNKADGRPPASTPLPSVTVRPAPAAPVSAPREFVDPAALRITGIRRTTQASPSAAGVPGAGGGASVRTRLTPPAYAPTVPAPRLVPPAPNIDRQEKVALDLLRKVLGTEQEPEWLRDLRHQHGVGADAVDALDRFYELKTTYGPEQDTVTLTAKECERAASGAEFFLVVVSGLAADSNPVLRLVPDPLHQLRIRPNGNVMLTGIKQSGSLIVEFGAGEEPDPS
ncbi:sacsin N-terminal ATP-binding-like domain-containing protein [Streptomyces pseudogriseolus]|uniref:sacsin N-terminal ATP-binding-like domain-containing protein n=1 Tax=Streptomyces pseudogriseolus TaxID=36817 RepID=UPI000A3A367D